MSNINEAAIYQPISEQKSQVLKGSVSYTKDVVMLNDVFKKLKISSQHLDVDRFCHANKKGLIFVSNFDNAKRAP